MRSNLSQNSLSLKVSAYLRINRADLAEQTLKAMKAIDEDNILTTLSACWITVCHIKINFKYSFTHLKVVTTLSSL